ncbi:MAG: hypothetical protein AAB697_00195 [Patescibacteria group bacterium]
MASLLPSSLRKTLDYFAKYSYPLTADELYFWQHGTRISKSKIKVSKQNFKIRLLREKYSQVKWKIAKRVGEQLRHFPSISAVFITGALAMNNCPANDDIDIMIVTSPNTLWITRFFVNLFLWSNRRLPGQTHAPNKICPNLWLDSSHLQITPHDLYRAHEILQAKVLWDRVHIHSQFLRSNSWVSKYLPIAYKYLSSDPSPLKGEGNARGEVFLKFLNSIFFVIQYLYMKPKMTSERVGPGFAFFHPNKDLPLDNS